MGYGTEVLVWHAPATSLDESRVILNINDWLDLLKKSKEPANPDNPGRALKYKVDRLRIAAKDVLKELGDQ
jgi:hypothetical protein